MMVSSSNANSLREAFDRAQQLHVDGKIAEAIAEYRAILELDKKHLATWHQLAQVLEKQGDFAGAVESYRKAIELDPQPPFWVYRHFGFALNHEGLLDEAIVAYQKAIVVQPEDATTYSLLGQVQGKQGDLEGAIESYQKATELSSELPVWVYLSLGEALSQKEQLEAAISAYEKALVLEPENAGIQRLLEVTRARKEANEGDRCHRAKQLQREGLLDEALAEFRAVLEVDGSNLVALHQVAQICETQGKWDEAVEGYRRAVEVDAEAPFWVYRHLGFALSQVGDLEGAVAAYEKAVELNPEDGATQSLLGQARNKKRDLEWVISSYQQSKPTQDSTSQLSFFQNTQTKLRTLLINTNKETHNYYIMIALQEAFQNNENVDFISLSSYQDALSVFIEKSCDTVVAVGGSGGDNPILSRLCAMARYSVLWTTEDPYELSNNIKLSDCFDVIFTNDLSSVPAYQGRAKHLPLAASSKYHNLPVRKTDDLYRYDLLFLGTAWPNRVETINKILSCIRRPLRAKIGLPYNEFLQPPNLIHSGLYSNWRTTNPNFAKLANTSRIVLCLFRDFSSASAMDASGSTLPPRLFEVALAGGFQLATRSSDEIVRYFQPHKEIVLCDDLENLVSNIDYYLDYPDKRIQIATAARERALLNHLYDHRVQIILSKIAELQTINNSNTVHFKTKKVKHILLVTHNVLGNRAGGVIEVYQEHLRKMKGYVFSYLYPDNKLLSI